MNSPEVTEVQDRGPAAYIAEFIGTLVLVFFITAVVSLYVAAPSATNPNPFIDFSVIGLVHAFVLFGLIQTLAIVSGAHFNPAVTAVMAALRQINPVDAAIYVVAQLAGGVAGALLTRALLKDEGEGVDYGVTLVSGRLNGDILPGMVVEALGTFFLVWVIVGVAVNPRAAKDWAAWAIGAALGLLVMVFGPLTGAGLNPARAFGPELVSAIGGGSTEWAQLFPVYVLPGLAGAGVAAFVYDFLSKPRKVARPIKEAVTHPDPIETATAK
jgi:MIP family channel proteins